MSGLCDVLLVWQPVGATAVVPVGRRVRIVRCQIGGSTVFERL